MRPLLASSMKKLFKIIGKSLLLVFATLILATLVVNMIVVNSAKSKIHTSISTIPHNHVGLLLGTSPLNRHARTNSYFVNRIKVAVKLYRSGKIDYIIASGDNHTLQYNEPIAMRDSLIAHGIPNERIILDYAGFRTLDSVVRAKKIFGCDSLTIISQSEHCERALFIAEAHGIHAIACPAETKAHRATRLRLAAREWLARDKMMLDLFTGKNPYFLGEEISIP